MYGVFMKIELSFEFVCGAGLVTEHIAIFYPAFVDFGVELIFHGAADFQHYGVAAQSDAQLDDFKKDGNVLPCGQIHLYASEGDIGSVVDFSLFNAAAEDMPFYGSGGKVQTRLCG